MARPLDNVRILAAEQFGAGPFGTMHLADLGAEVIKIEDPRGGDPMRVMGPPFLDDESAFRQLVQMLGAARLILCARHVPDWITIPQVQVGELDQAAALDLMSGLARGRVNGDAVVGDRPTRADAALQQPASPEPGGKADIDAVVYQGPLPEV